MKRFALLLPVYNRPEFARQAIDSVLAQTFSDYELIVVDDGSTDETRDLLRSYGTKIEVLRQENRGPENARNVGASRADAEYLAFLDSDDLLLPTALETYDRLIEKFASPPLVLGAMTYFTEGESAPAAAPPDGALEVLVLRDFLSKDRGIAMSNSKIVIRKDVFQKAGGLRSSTPSTFHLDDYNLIMRTCTSGPCIVLIRPKTIAYRWHAANSVWNARAMARGILSLVHAEIRGEYPGGGARRFARFACIGGPAFQWTWRTFKKLQVGLALFTLVQSAPMIAASLLKKAWIFLHGNHLLDTITFFV